MYEEEFLIRTKGWPLWVKSYQYVFEDLKITEEEFQEMIDYFTSIEEYKICNSLLTKKNK